MGKILGLPEGFHRGNSQDDFDFTARCNEFFSAEFKHVLCIAVRKGVDTSKPFDMEIYADNITKDQGLIMAERLVELMKNATVAEGGVH